MLLGIVPLGMGVWFLLYALKLIEMPSTSPDLTPMMWCANRHPCRTSPPPILTVSMWGYATYPKLLGTQCIRWIGCSSRWSASAAAVFICVCAVWEGVPARAMYMCF